jgi:hypothetical protein
MSKIFATIVALLIGSLVLPMKVSARVNGECTKACFSNKKVSAEVNRKFKKPRCIHDEAKAFLGLTFTPSYKNIYEIDLLNESASCNDVNASTAITLPRNSYFRQTLDRSAQTDNEIVVHVYSIEIDHNCTKNEEKNISKEYFSSPYKVCLNGNKKVSKSTFKRIGGFSTGVLVVPFKLRDKNIYSDSTIGPYISYKWEVIEVLFTAGLSQISISEVGTENIESKTGVTFGGGINFEIYKDWDIAVLTGIDHLSGQAGDEWKYQDKVWFSFAIGFNFTR